MEGGPWRSRGLRFVHPCHTLRASVSSSLSAPPPGSDLVLGEEREGLCRHTHTYLCHTHTLSFSYSPAVSLLTGQVLTSRISLSLFSRLRVNISTRTEVSAEIQKRCTFGGLSRRLVVTKRGGRRGFFSVRGKSGRQQLKLAHFTALRESLNNQTTCNCKKGGV